MRALLACIRKELWLLGRDLHGLALLFLMPLTFVLIMSLALQNQFAERAGTHPKVLVLDADQTALSRNLLAALQDGNAFELLTNSGDATAAALTDQTSAQASVDAQLRQGDYAFAISISQGFEESLRNNQPRKGVLTVSVAPDSSKQMESIFVSALRAALGGEHLRALLDSVGYDTTQLRQQTQDELTVRYAYQGKEATPSAVQQSVPAWLVFGAFFVVVPLSNTFIRERQQGTIKRLRSTNLSTFTLLAGKLVPYFCINQLQVLLMLLAGHYVVPLLGGEALQLNGSLPLLALMAMALSVCALGLALLIAVAASTTEQATLLGGTGNIILAALGGIMVPKFVMPATMQHIAQWSPMSWGLEGFLDVLLRSGSLRDIAPEFSSLILLGLTAMLIAWYLQQRSAD